MATTLDAASALIASATFVGKVEAAMLYVGADIIKTFLDAPGAPTPDEKNRMRLADEAIADQAGDYKKRFARILAVQPSITDTSTDADIVTMVRACWSYLSQLYQHR